MKPIIGAILLAATLAFAAPASQAQVFTASLSGPNESPPNASPGTGSAIVTLNPLANTMRVQVSFSGLLGTTTASHIHASTPTPFAGTAGVATTTPTFAGFPLGVTSGTYDQTLDMTLASSYNPAYVTANGGTPASAEAALFSAIASGQSYLNIHTTVVPGGEIRGFLVATPEPGTIGFLIAMGISGTLLARRRKPRLS
ncbi:MAG: hypothetical protein JWL77_4534 [Chthonomonadaceae bacterium]|nr:hypothetical protein [Chthonomonadaceae bacterium]